MSCEASERHGTCDAFAGTKPLVLLLTGQIECQHSRQWAAAPPAKAGFCNAVDGSTGEKRNLYRYDEKTSEKARKRRVGLELSRPPLLHQQMEKAFDGEYFEP